ncbi:Uncharacterised protein [Neisseria meningitidis]|nr:Uncharacterised protein [Neisseria meningitidis]CWR13588.1 Uncharacterised protein [Neisseria meningitidis]
MGRKQLKTCVWVSAVGRERNFAKVSFRFQTADFRLFFRQSHADSVRLDFIFFRFRACQFQFARIVLSRQQQGLRLIVLHLVDDRLLLRKGCLVALMV